MNQFTTEMSSDNLYNLLHALYGELIKEVPEDKVAPIFNQVAERYADRFFGSWFGRDDIAGIVAEEKEITPAEALALPELDEIASYVARGVDNNFDASVGVSWDNIRYHVQEYLAANPTTI